MNGVVWILTLALISSPAWAQRPLIGAIPDTEHPDQPRRDPGAPPPARPAPLPPAAPPLAPPAPRPPAAPPVAPPAPGPSAPTLPPAPVAPNRADTLRPRAAEPDLGPAAPALPPSIRDPKDLQFSVPLQTNWVTNPVIDLKALLSQRGFNDFSGYEIDRVALRAVTAEGGVAWLVVGAQPSRSRTAFPRQRMHEQDLDVTLRFSPGPWLIHTQGTFLIQAIEVDLRWRREFGPTQNISGVSCARTGDGFNVVFDANGLPYGNDFFLDARDCQRAAQAARLGVVCDAHEHGVALFEIQSQRVIGHRNSSFENLSQCLAAIENSRDGLICGAYEDGAAVYRLSPLGLASRGYYIQRAHCFAATAQAASGSVCLPDRGRVVRLDTTTLRSLLAEYSTPRACLDAR